MTTPTPGDNEPIDTVAALGDRIVAAIAALRAAGWTDQADEIATTALALRDLARHRVDDGLHGLVVDLVTAADRISHIASLIGDTFPDPHELKGTRP